MCKRWKNKTYMYLVKWSQFEKPLKIRSQILSIKVKIGCHRQHWNKQEFQNSLLFKIEDWRLNWQIKSTKIYVIPISTWIEIWTLNFLHYICIFFWYLPSCSFLRSSFLVQSSKFDRQIIRWITQSVNNFSPEKMFEFWQMFW